MTQLYVQAISQIGQSTIAVEFTPQQPLAFEAGQFIVICSQLTQEKFYFSIANCSNLTHTIEVHIGGITDNPRMHALIRELQFFREIECSTPSGYAYLRESDRPMLLICGGSGYSYARGIIKQELKSNRTRPITLIWGGKTIEALYEHQTLLELSQHIDRFNYHAVLEQAPQDFAGQQGNVLDITYQQSIQFELADIYVCGRPDMVKSAHQYMLENLGVQDEHFFSDITTKQS